MVTVASEVFSVFPTPLFDQGGASDDTRGARRSGLPPQANARSSTGPGSAASAVLWFFAARALSSVSYS